MLYSTLPMTAAECPKLGELPPMPFGHYPVSHGVKSELYASQLSMPDDTEIATSPAVEGEGGSPASNLERSSSAAAGVKRKRGGPTISSRTVANLTPEQLDKKRKNDREAQRAIRERTRAQIDRLNQKIAELEGADHYQERLAAIRQRDLVQIENEELKRKMAQVVAMLSPIIGNSSQRLDDLASAALERNALPIPQSQTVPTSTYLPPPPRAMTSPAVSIMSPVSHSSLPNSFGSNMQHNTSYHTQHRAWDSPGHGHATYDVASPRPQSATQEYRRYDDNHGLGYMIDSNNALGPVSVYSSGATFNLNEKFIPPVHNVPPIYKILPRSYPACALDNLLMDYLRDSRQRVLRGDSTPAEEAGPDDPNFNVLVDPNTGHHAHLLSKVFMQILLAFPDLKTLPEQVSVVYMMYVHMRWQLNPTKENYERIPEWMRPRHVQLLQPFPHWMNYIPWPELRMFATQDPVDINIFFIPYTTTFSINWPYDPQSCLIPRSNSQVTSPVANIHSPAHTHMSPASLITSTTVSNSNTPTSRVDSDRLSSRMSRPNHVVARHTDDSDEILVINPLFREHMYNLENWSLGEAFAKTFPNWRGSFKVKA